jgi:hypothetical protein
MKRMLWIFASLPILAAVCLAQTPLAEARLSNAQTIDSILSPLERRIIDVAKAMPDEKYSFAPTCGEFRGVRTFAEQLKHIAADLYLDGAAILGEKPPGDVGLGESGSSTVRTKPEIIAYVKAAFAYMHRAAARSTTPML